MTPSFPTRRPSDIRSLGMHQQSEFGFAAHWAYKQGGSAPDGQAGWIRDLIEILEQTHDPEEFLENTRIAMYQDRIFAFTPKGSLHQLPKGATRSEEHTSELQSLMRI